MSTTVHALTPRLSVLDPRGLAVREVNYHRATAQAAAARRIHGNRFDAAGHCVAQRDPRLWALHEENADVPANLTLVYALSGRPLSRDSADGGFACTLFGDAGQAMWFEDGLGNRRELQYDHRLRPVALFEEAPDQPRVCSGRYQYADADPAHQPDNGCGRLQRQDDTAGSRQLQSYSLTGEVSAELRRFLIGTDWPDWPQSLEAHDDLLEPEAAQTRWQYGPLGQVLMQLDAAGHQQLIKQTRDGALREVWVKPVDSAQQRVMHGARYDALGQIEAETLGNGVRIQREYRAEDGRLLRLTARRAGAELLQDLHYGYDPAGNVLSFEDKAQPLRHFANQRIEPRCQFSYDSLNQLIEATGWEAGTAGRGPGVSLDPGAVSNYRQTYHYDAGGNLLELVHVGAQSHGRKLEAAPYSNRCLPPGADFSDSFDANGNLLQLQAGQSLRWDVRNQLGEVRPVTRDSGPDDRECYLYDGGGQRLRKVRLAEAANRTLHREVRYLPGIELHTNSATGERFQSIVVQAGSCAVRVLHWEEGRPGDLPQDQYRYALSDHLGSASLELDAEAALISHEVFHPFGTSAWWSGRNEIEAGYKTLRYSGKERDATGLYYYGARYYIPWLQRWLSPDPAGEVDGLNLYCMVGNAPINHRDRDGRQGYDVMDDVETDVTNAGRLIGSGLDSFAPDARDTVLGAARLGRGWIRNARAAFRDKTARKQVTRALASTFGADTLEEGFRSALKHDLYRTLSTAGDYLKRLSTGERWRLHLVHLDKKGTSAYTAFSDINGPRIVLDQRSLQRGVVDLAVTLLHESLHAMTMTDAYVFTDDIVDYWYSVPGVGKRVSDANLLEATHSQSRDIVSKGPVEGAMTPDVRRLFVTEINKVTGPLGLPRAADSKTRNEYFRTIPRVRKALTLRNADSVAGFALMFRNYKR